MIRDLDLLVPPGRKDRATAVLGELGYAVIAEYEPGHNALADFARPHDPGAVDLHLELIEFPCLLSAAEVWERAQEVEADGIRFLAPAPTDHALHHLLHAQIHYLGNFYRSTIELRQLYECSVLINTRKEIDWAMIVERFARYRLQTALESYVLGARELFEARWPLPSGPSRAAFRHWQACRRHLCRPWLTALEVPVANVRSSFAWHRMAHLYGEQGSLVARQLRHAMRFLRKKSTRTAFGKLFRVN
jgi:Uncharacterised nucleotidyltransferase